MAQNTQLKAQARAKAGKGAARAIRREGGTPAVIYGDNKEPVIISLDTNELKKALANRGFFTNLCDLDVDGTTHRVIARDVQRDPVRDFPIHVDFLRVTKKTQVRVNVPVVIMNEDKSEGVKAGGVLRLIHHELEVLCAATDIPEKFELDVSALKVGDNVHLSDMSLPSGVESTYSEDVTILTLNTPKGSSATEEEENAAEEASAATTEDAGEKKE